MGLKDALVVLAAITALAGCKSEEPKPPSAEEVAEEVVKQMEAKADHAATKEREAAARLGELEKNIADIQAEVDRLIETKEKAYAALLAANSDAEKATAQAEVDKADAAVKVKMDELKALRAGARHSRDETG